MPVIAYQGHASDSASKAANESPDDVIRADRGAMTASDFYGLASVAVAPFAVTARERGVAGDDITIQFVDPAGVDAALGVAVADSAITVNLATDAGGVITSTAIDVVAAVEATPAATALIDISVPVANADDLVVASGPHSLSGGDAVSPGLASFLAGNPRHDGQGGSINTGGR